MERKAVDQVNLHHLVEERIVKDQFEELTKAIYSMGEYCLAEEYRHQFSGHRCLQSKEKSTSRKS